MDTFSAKQRSEVMRQVHSKGTKTEMVVRRIVHSMGYRYRLHSSELPGNPDLVFINRKKVIFVHGCFWHQHTCRRGNREPSSRRDYWVPKLGRNKKRDKENQRKLKELGWYVMVIWECELKDQASLTSRIRAFLEAGF
jgi:DNA mismatch endonuclease (patch repair protein)